MTEPSPPEPSPVSIEVARYDWRRIKSFHGDAAELPEAITDLSRADSESAARSAYWRIDNVALVQGRLSECCAPLASCLTVALSSARAAGRSYIFDLLATIAGGYDEHVDIDRVGPVSVRDCVRRMAAALPVYAEELFVHGNPSCVDILGMCAVHDEALRAPVKGILEKARGLPSGSRIADLIDATLEDLW